ncbi:capsular biosynthesis protein [Caenispirillum bisanense]|uniref:capsule biosynthesis protein n=1 Tax=Caenispirillum bisanense TaxID=414052 RepID=UPI0031DF09F0
MRRAFLFLQGPATPFFAHLSDRLRAQGHAVHRIHFCAGDAAYWGGRPAWWFREPLTALRDFLDDFYRRHGITDQILFGDRRPVHRPAAEHGEVCGVRTHVFEEGYFRPYWVTLEREGVNGHSLLPRDPDWFWEVGGALDEPESVVSFLSPFWKRAMHDVVYHVANAANPVLFPRYRPHGIYAPLEYAGYLKRFAWLRLFGKRERERMGAFIARKRSYFVLPLQLNSDAQIRDHSRFGDMGEVIEYVAESFARNAPHDHHLVIKNHPLDMGLMPYDRIIKQAARRLGLSGRIHFFEDGDLLALLKQARGVVTVNSTAGIVALEQGTPTLTLSDPIYNLPGLTSQVRLDEFWQAPSPPDGELFRRFRRVVIRATQINGGFYCARGIALAVDNAAHVLMAECSPLEALL